MKDKNRGISPYLNSSANSAVTQPVADTKNRTQKIKVLHMQFEDLKKKIKDVESKNAMIIETINKDYDFKKKPKNKQHSEANPIIYYERPQEQSQTIIEKKSHKKDNSDGDYKGHIKKNSNIKKNVQINNLHQSIQYPKTQHLQQDRQLYDLMNSKSNLFYRAPAPTASPYIYSPQRGSQYFIQPQQQQLHINQFNGISPYQLSIQFPNNMTSNQSRSSLDQNLFQYEEALKLQREKISILQSQLQERQENKLSLKKLQKKYNSLAANYTQTVQLCLQQFFEEVLKKRLIQIDKCVKKNQNKIKKIQLKIKDREEDRKSRRLIYQHREKRSQSRSKKSSSPMQQAIVYRTKRQSSKKSTCELTVPNQIRSKQSEPCWPSQQFQQIAIQYQEIIRTKTKQNEEYEAKLREKQQQLNEIASRCAKLQLKIADLTDIPKIAKSRKNSQKEQNLLANLIFDNDGDVQNLNKKIGDLEAALEGKKKQLIIKDSQNHDNQNKLSEYLAKIRKNQGQVNRLKQQLKKLEKDRKLDVNIQNIKKLQEENQAKNAQYCLLKDKFTKLQNDKIKKQCQNLSLTNKIKKLQAQLLLNEQKMSQLQKIIQSNNGSDTGDLLEKSMYIQKIDQRDIQALQDQKQSLQQELLKNRQQIFLLQKNNQNISNNLQQMQENNDKLTAQIQNLQLQNQSMRVALKAQQFQKYRNQVPNNPLKKLLEEGDCLSQDQDDHLIVNQLQDFKRKYEETQHLLKMQNQKTFDQNRKVLKLTSELKYFKEQLFQRQVKYQKLRKQHQESKCLIGILQGQLQGKDSQLQVQKKINAQKIKQIESQWRQFEQQVKNNYQQRLDVSSNSHDLRTSRLSESSFANYKNTYNNVNSENQKLMERIKQAQKIIQFQKEMDQKILNEYRSNVQKIKSELKEKIRQNQTILSQNQILKRKIKSFEQNQLKHQNAPINKQGYAIQETSSQKIIELQNELNQIRQLSLRREGVQQQLYNQVSEKQKQIEELTIKINSQERRIQQLQDLIELKDMNLNSHISIQPKPRMRESLQSHNSLKYSMLSSHTNRDKTIELDLSEVTQSFIDHSVIQNVSEVFAREEFPYEKMNLKRIEQRRLFQKTAAYIKSLKNAIQQKNKKIKLLQKKIKQLRNSQLVRKDIYEIKINTNNDLDIESDDADSFRDNYSVQLQSTNNQRYKLKQLQHETKLTIEQNNLLNIRVEGLQDELLKAEQQEEDLMKMKDLYKEEIKNMVKKNQEQIKTLEQQIKRERQKNQQSESIQKMEALKQIFLKIISSFVSIQSQGSSKSRRREQKKKQLQDFIKVACNLFSYDSQIRQRLLSSWRQAKR